MSFSFRRSISFPSLYTVFHSGVVCSSFLTAPLINLKFNSFVSQTPDLFTPLGITGIGVLASAYYFPAGSWTALQYCCYKNLASRTFRPHPAACWPTLPPSSSGSQCCSPDISVWGQLLSSFKCNHINFQNSGPGYFSSWLFLIQLPFACLLHFLELEECPWRLCLHL